MQKWLAVVSALAVVPMQATAQQYPTSFTPELATRPAIDRDQFSALCEEFSWSSLIARLHRRIEECCALSTEAKACGGTPWQ